MSSTEGRPRRGGKPAPLEKTKTAGVFRRRGKTATVYVVAWSAPNGKPQRKTFPTYDEARAFKGKTAATPTPAPSRERFGTHASPGSRATVGARRAG